MIINLSDILSNPYRDLDRNPLNENKVQELVNSINETGFWDNVVVRKRPDGKYELAYGHHRLEAAKRAGITKADFIVKDFDDALMIKVMNAENSETYGYSILSLLEAVRATVNALAEGRIPAFEISSKTPKASLRYAPSFTPGNMVSASKFDAHPYTAFAVGGFLGYTKKDGKGGLRADDNIEAALRALYLIEAGVYKEEVLSQWNVSQLMKNTQDRWERLMMQREREKAQAKQEAERLRIEQERKAFLAEQEAKRQAERVRITELEVKKREAREEENKAREKALEESIAKRRVKEAERKELIKRELPKFEEKFKQAKEAAKVSDKELEVQRTSRQAAVTASTLIGKFERLSGKLTAINTKKQLTYKEAPTPQFLEEVSKAARNRDITTNDRELLRQAMVAVGDWFIENSNLFLPIKKVDVLKEANLKEEAKRSSSKKEKE